MKTKATKSKIVHEETLVHAGSYEPTIVLHQRESGRCTLYGYWCDQERGVLSRTMAVFYQQDWKKALAKAEKMVDEAGWPIQLGMGSTGSPRLNNGFNIVSREGTDHATAQ